MIPSFLAPFRFPTVLPNSRRRSSGRAGGDRADGCYGGWLHYFGSRSRHGGPAGGATPMRDIPRFGEMLDSGAYDAKLLATMVVGIEDMPEAYGQVLYRTTITAIMVC